MSISTLVVDNLVDSWVNGNRQHVKKVVCNQESSPIIAQLAAKIAIKLAHYGQYEPDIFAEFLYNGK